MVLYWSERNAEIWIGLSTDNGSPKTAISCCECVVFVPRIKQGGLSTASRVQSYTDFQMLLYITANRAPCLRMMHLNYRRRGRKRAISR